MPRCFSISIQSEVAWRVALRALTLPAILIAPANSSSFSVSVVLPASGWEMMAKVRRRFTSSGRVMGAAAVGGGRRPYAKGPGVATGALSLIATVRLTHCNPPRPRCFEEPNSKLF